MCGICGFNWRDPELGKRMASVIAHRGPDQDGVWCDEHVTLGHRRLSIIDLSEAGRQPMANEDGTIQVVFNGEIYNFADIRKDLEGAGATWQDAEVVVDKGLVTSRTPKDLPAFCAKLVEEIAEGRHRGQQRSAA